MVSGTATWQPDAVKCYLAMRLKNRLHQHKGQENWKPDLLRSSLLSSIINLYQ